MDKKQKERFKEIEKGLIKSIKSVIHEKHPEKKRVKESKRCVIIL